MTEIAERPAGAAAEVGSVNHWINGRRVAGTSGHGWAPETMMGGRCPLMSVRNSPRRRFTPVVLPRASLPDG